MLHGASSKTKRNGNKREDIRKHLSMLNIPPDSDVGQMLIKLDEAYSLVVTKKNMLRKSKLEISNLEEQIELMELAIMHRVNKNARGV